MPKRPSIGSIIPTGPLAGHLRRPHIDRTTYLDRDDIRSLTNAATFADEGLATPLNTLLTIAWGNSALFQKSDQSWGELQTRLFDRLIRWLVTRGVPIAYLWVRERKRGMGRHTHVMLHLGPRPAELVGELQTYLTNRFFFKDNKKSIGVHFSLGKFGLHTQPMRAGALCYLLKGLAPDDFRYMGLDGETESIGTAVGIEFRGQQGVIDIKRCGFSQTIGPKARRQAGWQEIRDFAAVRRVLKPNKQPRSA